MRPTDRTARSGVRALPGGERGGGGQIKRQGVNTTVKSGNFAMYKRQIMCQKGSGTIRRRSKMDQEKWMKFQEKPVNTGVLSRFFGSRSMKIGLCGTI